MILNNRASQILEFISVFSSPSNKVLFKDCACYWFAQILRTRFPRSTIVYDPHLCHFATKIEGIIYDIEGIVREGDYEDWEIYSSYADDAELVVEECVKLNKN